MPSEAKILKEKFHENMKLMNISADKAATLANTAFDFMNSCHGLPRTVNMETAEASFAEIEAFYEECHTDISIGTISKQPLNQRVLKLKGGKAQKGKSLDRIQEELDSKLQRFVAKVTLFQDDWPAIADSIEDQWIGKAAARPRLKTIQETVCQRVAEFGQLVTSCQRLINDERGKLGQAVSVADRPAETAGNEGYVASGKARSPVVTWLRNLCCPCCPATENEYSQLTTNAPPVQSMSAGRPRRPS